MAGIVRQERVLLETPSTKLEAIVFTAPERTNGAAAVILHPYALLGGTMHDHMVLELFRAAAQSPAFSLVIRYNQRGVGRSSGWMNVLGGSDRADVLDVVEFAAAQLPGPEKHVVVIGYSWGSCVGAYALSHPSVAAYVGVSPPLGGLSWLLQARKHFGEVLRATHVPRLLLLGDQDQFTGEAALKEAVLGAGGCLLRQDDSFEPEADAAAAAATARCDGSGVGAGGSRAGGGGALPGGALPGAERRELLLRVFPGESHFWMVHSSMAAEYVVHWLEGLLARQRQQAAAAAADAAADEQPVEGLLARQLPAAAAAEAPAAAVGGGAPVAAPAAGDSGPAATAAMAAEAEGSC